MSILISFAPATQSSQLNHTTGRSLANSNYKYGLQKKLPKTPKMGVLGGTKNGTWGARIKILRPLFNTNTPPKTPI